MYQNVWYTMLTALTIGSCTVYSKQQFKNVPFDKLNLDSAGAAINKIAFLTFQITTTDTAKDLYDIKLVNTIFSNGSLKKNTSAEETTIEANYLYYRISGGESKGNDKHFERVINPLSRVFEYTSEDGKLGKKIVSKSPGELVIRFQYDQNTKSISIFKPDQYTLKLKPIYHATL